MMIMGGDTNQQAALMGCEDFGSQEGGYMDWTGRTAIVTGGIQKELMAAYGY